MIYSDRVNKVEEGIRGIGGKVHLASFSGGDKVFAIGDELVSVSSRIDGRTATIKCGDSAAAILEKAGIINFSQPDPDVVVKSSIVGS